MGATESTYVRLTGMAALVGRLLFRNLLYFVSCTISFAVSLDVLVFFRNTKGKYFNGKARESVTNS